MAKKKIVIKHPGAFTRKAKAAGMGVQSFAKKVLSHPKKYSRATKTQASLARLGAKMGRSTRKRG